LVAILVGSRDYQTQFWKGDTQGTFHQSLVSKLCWNHPWVAPFQNCVRHFRPPTKMTTTAELNLT
jgi:hypothetical protein